MDLLIQAYALVPENIRGELWLLGDGIPEVVRELRQLVRDRELDSQVRFLGRVSPLAVRGYLKRASVYTNVLIHRYYGAGFVEALAAGLCIVALNLGSWPEIANFEDIPVLVGKNVDETARLLAQALRDPLLRQRYARQGQQFASRLDLYTHLDVFLQAYEQAIDLSASGGSRGR